MCAVSNVTDYGLRNWPSRFPEVYPHVNPSPFDPLNPPFNPSPINLVVWPSTNNNKDIENIQRQLDAFRKEFLEFKKLVLAAKDFDEKTNQADCEADEKVLMIRKIADILGVTVDDIFPKE